jgi:hypothetical protein
MRPPIFVEQPPDSTPPAPREAYWYCFKEYSFRFDKWNRIIGRSGPPQRG